MIGKNNRGFKYRNVGYAKVRSFPTKQFFGKAPKGIPGSLWRPPKEA